ncbi:hypothetical protein ACS0TY_032748 [Phlomoides rotata]
MLNSEQVPSSIRIINMMFLFLSLFLLPFAYLLLLLRTSSQRLPPGSLGLPFIGQSLSLLWAMRSNTAEKWMAHRAKKYGPVSKLSLFGKPTVFIHGEGANKLMFTSDGSKLSNHQTESVKMILGERSLLELVGDDHKRIRCALASFLKPDSLKNYIGKMEEEVRGHLQMHWQGKSQVTVLPLMKTLTFNIICSLLFGVERGPRRETFVLYFQQMIDGMWSIPIDFPFTRFNRSLKASAKVQTMLKELISEKRIQLANGASSHQDLITCLLTIRGEQNQQLVSDDEIIHNVMLIMVAGHDTSSVLITFLVRVLENHPTVYTAVLKGTATSLPLSCFSSSYKSKLTYNFRCRTRRDQEKHSLWECFNMGRSWQDEVYLESGNGDSSSLSSDIWRFPEDVGGHRVSRILDTKRMASKTSSAYPCVCEHLFIFLLT